jgi:hypothetical protein
MKLVRERRGGERMYNRGCHGLFLNCVVPRMHIWLHRLAKKGRNVIGHLATLNARALLPRQDIEERGGGGKGNCLLIGNST